MPTTAFHAVFIFFILILTIIFAHFLIRLCMLAFRPRARFRMMTKSSDMQPTGPPTRSHLPNCRRPIRLSPPYNDQEMALPGPNPDPHSSTSPASHSTEQRDQDDLTEMDIEKALPAAPPPAYGRWRGSVRVDPEHPDLQQLTRQLVMAGHEHGRRGYDRTARHGQRHHRGPPPPPSYTTHHHHHHQHHRGHLNDNIMVTSDIVVQEDEYPADSAAGARLAPAPVLRSRSTRAFF